ncbi:FtsX-like permease family protein [Oceanirhabdus sp. W0125-5]|uniref:FtsX-like permease family protein n=1 Tax=Oceanirhabdus sp. W0125-5 TaxID=2999116 RepID=UPI0022F2D031|nr:ABC transporter permease [Oceanirhabdus sp. W0125-5]WBW98122.1 ABC transporter permease [Oceanirhabdus sp. W0125-5]
MRNAKRSIKDYLIYFITLTLCVALFYSFMSLSSPNYELNTSGQFDLSILYTYIKYASYFITAVLTFLVSYVNKYMMKRRKREFATYVLLGMEQKTVAFLFFLETFIMGIISILMGIILGSFFSQVLTALIIETIDGSITFGFRLYGDTVIRTIIFFIIIFTVIGLFNVKTLSKIKLIDMFNDHKKTEIQFSRGKWFYLTTAILALSSYVFAFLSIKKYLKVMHISSEYLPEKDRLPIMIGIGMLIGTYLAFYSSAYIIVLIKEKFTKFKYKNTNLFLIGQLLSKINTTSILMATVTVTLFVSIICFILGPIMSEWVSGYLPLRSVFDVKIDITYKDIRDIEDRPVIDYTKVHNYLSQSEFEIEDYCELERYFLEKEDFNRRRKDSFPILAISLSDYNKLREMAGYESIKLGNDEFAIQWKKTIPRNDIENYINENSSIKVGSKVSSTDLKKCYTEPLGEGIYNNYTECIFILPDKECKDLTIANVNFYANTRKVMEYEFAESVSNFVTEWFKEEYKHLFDKYGDQHGFKTIISVNTKTQQVNSAKTTALMMKFLGIYCGGIFLIICLTVLALQQLADSFEHKMKFKILQKIGVDKGETSKLILKQIGIYFNIPIIAALLGAGVFLYVFGKQTSREIYSYMGSDVFMMNIAISIIMVVSIYVCYFIATYLGFKRNIDN